MLVQRDLSVSALAQDKRTTYVLSEAHSMKADAASDEIKTKWRFKWIKWDETFENDEAFENWGNRGNVSLEIRSLAKMVPDHHTVRTRNFCSSSVHEKKKMGLKPSESDAFDTPSLFQHGKLVEEMPTLHTIAPSWMNPFFSYVSPFSNSDWEIDHHFIRSVKTSFIELNRFNRLLSSVWFNASAASYFGSPLLISLASKYMANSFGNCRR